MDDLVQQAEKRVGSVLRERWTIDELIGVGGMAAVYRATHRNGNEVAIKILHSDISDNEAICRRFQREGYVANRIKHRSAVKVFDDDKTEDGAAFLVMELVRGENVEARRERLGGWLPLPEVLGIADQLLDALAAAHAQGVIHRDINPENMFLTHEGVVKVLDFGIARLQGSAPSAELTMTGAMLGTAGYMSPEQARGQSKEVDPQSDIWAVGASMFTLLCGQLVHQADTLNETLALAATQPARSLATVLPDLDQGVIALIDKALRWEKAERWPDALAMQRELRNVADRALDRRRASENAALELTLSAPLSEPRAPSDRKPTVTRLISVARDEEIPTARHGWRSLLTPGGVEAPLALPPSRTVVAVMGAAALHGITLALMLYALLALGEKLRAPPAPSGSVEGPAAPVEIAPAIDPAPVVAPPSQPDAAVTADAAAATIAPDASAPRRWKTRPRRRPAR
jgi:eukaryotic-like serine/threonine-protein kinase